MKFLSLFLKPKQSLTLLVDIGSASVGTALAYVEQGKPVRIIATERKELAFLETLTAKSFSIAMDHALEASLKAIQKQTPRAPDRILVTLSTPWLFVKTRHISVSHPVPVRITERLVSEAIEQEIEAMKKDTLSSLPGEDIYIVENSIIDLKVNGYRVLDPYGKKSKSLEISFVVGVSSKKVAAQITRRIGRHFHTTSLRLSSFPLAAFSAVRDMFPEKQNFLFIDITGEATDVTLIEDGLLCESVSFPVGKNFLLRKIASTQKIPHVEAETALHMYLEGRMERAQGYRVGDTVHESLTEWRSRLEKALVKIAHKKSAEAIFFSCDQDVSHIFEESIHGAETGDIHYSPEIYFFDQYTASQFIVFEPGVSRDPFLGVGALLANKLNLV